MTNERLSVGLSFVVCGCLGCGQCVWVLATVGVGYRGRCGPLPAFNGQWYGVYAFNEQSGCGKSLWACLLWSVCASDVVSVCGCWLQWALVTVCVAAPCRLFNCGVYAFSEQSGCGNSQWVCLLWSVGASDVVSVWA